MIAKMMRYFSALQQNHQLLRQAVNQIGDEYERLTLDELARLLDTPHGIYEFEAVYEGVKLSFTLDEWGLDRKTRVPGFCINAAGLPTLLGIKPGYHFYKNPDGSVFY